MSLDRSLKSSGTLSSVRSVPSCQRTRSLRTGLVLLVPPVTEPHTIMLFGPHEACVASVTGAEIRWPPVQL